MQGEITGIILAAAFAAVAVLCAVLVLRLWRAEPAEHRAPPDR